MKRLTAKEEEVLERIWTLGPCAPKDVVATYDEPRPHVNTIATMFQSLERKGLLTHEPKGRGYIYTAAVTREQYADRGLKGLLDKYFGNSYMSVVSSLVREEKISVDELKALIALVEKGGA